MTRTIVIGDIHGCGVEFITLLDKLRFPLRGDRLILVGDLFDRGPLPQLVLQTILDHRKQGAAAGYSLESVCGNHDAELLDYCRTLYESDTENASLARTQLEAVRAVDGAGMLEDLTLFLTELAKIDAIRDSQKRWAVVHAGVDPKLGLDATPLAVKMTIRAYPSTPAWYNQYDGRDGLIICGHQHQPEPLVRLRNGRPVVVNVDTGCCYGNRLTAYLVEENRFADVPAARTYYRERP